jgi:prepilin-type N-terminal cleavage/methylation domain-containing protein
MKSIPKNGFTLIEVIVSAFVFSIIVLVVGGLYTNILNLQRRANAEQKIQENALYVMELMSREIRVSQITNQDAQGCNLTTLTMTHPVNGTVTYTLNGSGVLQRTAGGVTTDLNTSDIKFAKLSFCVLGSGVNDLQPTRVTILASIQNATGKDIITTSFQTTVTSRDVQSEF